MRASRARRPDPSLRHSGQPHYRGQHLEPPIALLHAAPIVCDMKKAWTRHENRDTILQHEDHIDEYVRSFWRARDWVIKQTSKPRTGTTMHVRSLFRSGWLDG